MADAQYYIPNVPPSTPEEILTYLREEFFRVSAAFNPTLEGIHEIHYKLPKKLISGMVLYFAGPASPTGSGVEGLYRYQLNKTWVFVG